MFLEPLDARVLQKGRVSVGDAVALRPAASDFATIMDVFTQWHTKDRSLATLEKALNSTLSMHHRRKIQDWVKQLMQAGG